MSLFNIYTYSVLYACFGIMSLSYHTAFNSSLSTLEKRYRFSSSTSAYIMITDNVATILTNLFIGFYGRTAHKPRWMAIGCLVTGLSILMTSLPFFIYGPVEEKNINTVSYWSNNSTSSSRVPLKNTTSSDDQLCYDQVQVEDCSEVDGTWMMTAVAVFCFGASNFFRGFGTSIYFTYGTPYLDDNVGKGEMPTFFAVVFAIRGVGAPLGFTLSHYALKIYENPLKPPSGYGNSDVRWVGAWWIPFLISGTFVMLLSLPLSFFPREFKKRRQGTYANAQQLQLDTIESQKGAVATTDDDHESHVNSSRCFEKKDDHDSDGTQVKAKDKAKDSISLRELPGEIMAVVTNPLIVCQMMGNMFRGIGIIGYFVFQTKYMESQFMQTASDAGLTSGTTGFLAKMVGVVLGGLLITGFRPSAKKLTLYIFLVELTSVFGLLLGAMTIGPTNIYPMTTMNPSDNSLVLNNQCNTDCHCGFVKYQPVCSPTGLETYFSPCHAGCEHAFKSPLPEKVSSFTDCKCIEGYGKPGFDKGGLESCSRDAFPMKVYAYSIAVGSMISGSGRAGNMVTFLRSIRPEQKSMAVAIGSFWHSLMVAIPYPILYGKIFDSTCLVWSYKCGQRGNCSLYDVDRLKYIYHGVSITLIALGSCFDLFMIFLSPRLGNLYEERNGSQPENLDDAGNSAKKTASERYPAIKYAKKLRFWKADNKADSTALDAVAIDNDNNNVSKRNHSSS